MAIRNHFPNLWPTQAKHPGSAAGRTWIGFWIGLCIAPVGMVEPTGLAPLKLMLTLALAFPLGGAIFGYLVFLGCEPTRWERFDRVWCRVTIGATIGLLVLFPGFWLQAVALSPFVALLLLGMIHPVAMFAVGAAWGLHHLFRSCVGVPTKSSAKPPARGVWDADLDQGGPGW